MRISNETSLNDQTRTPYLNSVTKLADIGLVKKLAAQCGILPYNFAHQLLFQGGLYSGFFSDLEEAKHKLKIQINTDGQFISIEDETHLLTFQKNGDEFNLIGYGKKKLQNLYPESQIRTKKAG